MPAEPIFELRELRLAGRRGDRLRVEALRIDSGVTAVIGPSGAGKTSLLDILVGFETGFTGQRDFHVPAGAGVPLFWSPAQGGLWPHLTVREHLAAVSPHGDGAAVSTWLQGLGLAAVAEARPDTLSQGQCSRLGLGRALASEARVLVLDEPLVHVEPGRLADDWRLLIDSVRGRGGSLVFSTHDPQRVLAHGDAVLALHEGELLYRGPVEPLYREPASEQLASVLGPFTWLPPAERQLWADAALPACTRPEQLRLSQRQGGPILVGATDHRGAVSQSLLIHEAASLQRSFCHITTPGLRQGARVVLQVCVLLLLALLVACTAEAPGTLAMRAVRHQQLPPIGSRLLAPRALAMLSDQRLLVLDNGGRVLILDADDGAVQTDWMMPDYRIGRPEGVCELRDGRIAVADTHYSRVVFFDRKGTVQATLGSHGTGPGQFIYPIKIIQDPAGNLYVAEYGSNDRIQKFDERGRCLLSFGAFGSGPGQFQRPSGLVWYQGLIYVADAINHRVQVFSDQGEFRGVLGDGKLEFKLPYDLSMGPAGDLYVVEYGAGRVSRFTLGGELVGRFGSSGLGQGQLRTPWGLTVADDGRVFVADTGNKRIVEWQR